MGTRGRFRGWVARPILQPEAPALARAVMMRRTRKPGPALRTALWLAASLGLAACTTPAPEPAPASPSPQAEPTAPPPPTPTRAPAPAAVEPAAAGPVSAAQAQQAQRLALSAIEMLELGHEDLALPEVQRALNADPANRLAQSLLRQAQTDPQTLLGRESFAYRLQSGDSLSRVAGRFLGDVHLFYALARYNEIKVPRQVQEGQWIRVPGKAPSAAAIPPSTAPSTAPAPSSSGTPGPAGQTPQPTQASVPPAAGAGASSPAAGSAPTAREPMSGVANGALAAQHYRRGLGLLARQKPVEAIEAFDAALERDPQHANAKLRRAQAVNQVNGLIRLLENSIHQLDGQIAKDPGNASLKAQRNKLIAERERLLTVK